MEQFNDKYEKDISIYRKRFEDFEKQKLEYEMEDVTFKPTISKHAKSHTKTKSVNDVDVNLFQR